MSKHTNEFGKGHYIQMYPWNTKQGGKSRTGSATTVGWRDPAYFVDKNTELEAGYNVAYRIPKGELVFDIDIRSFPVGVDQDEYLDELAVKIGFLDFDSAVDSTRAVETGGGGWHLYFETNLEAELIKGVAAPGLEVKKHGGHVTVEGSRHKSGAYYYLATDKAPIQLNATATALVERPPGNKDDDKGGQLTPEQLKECFLDLVEAETFNNNDDWFKIMAACHHVTAGDAMDEFVEWSTSDDEYRDQDYHIKSRWESLSCEKSGAKFKIGTLITTLESLGLDAQPLKTKLAFSDVLNPKHEVDPFVVSAMAAGKTVAKESDEDTRQLLGGDVAEPGEAMRAASALTPTSSDEQISICLRLIRDASDIERMKAIAVVSKVTGMTKGDIKGLIKAMHESATTDIAMILRDLTLQSVFADSKHILCEPSGEIYVYRSNKWVNISDRYLKRLVQVALTSIRETNPDFTAPELQLITQASELTVIKVACAESVLFKPQPPAPIINCTNGEVHMLEDGGCVFKEHSYKSYLTSSIDVEYDPSAECPLFMDTIHGIFKNYDDADQLVELVGELFGYAIQPYKNISSFWVLKGPGGDGKSTLIKILSALMGSSVLRSTVKVLSTGEAGGDNHASDSLVGVNAVVIEELPHDYVLPDSGVKLLSEGTLMTANPKFKKPFQFNYSGVLVMCCNSFPLTRDVSFSMRRRAKIIPFNRSFNSSDTDKDRVKKIINNKQELAGVLNWALEGLKRLRKRGDFCQPPSCAQATENWVTGSNNTMRFLEECVQRTSNKDQVATFHDLYMLYRTWAISEDIAPKYTKNKNSFKRELGAANLDVRIGNKKQLRVFGGVLKETEAKDGDLFT